MVLATRSLTPIMLHGSLTHVCQCLREPGAHSVSFLSFPSHITRHASFPWSIGACRKLCESRQHSPLSFVLDIVSHCRLLLEQRLSRSERDAPYPASKTRAHANMIVTALQVSSAFWVSLGARSRASSAVTNTCQDLNTT